jgi:uncharacterized membrane protein
MEPNAMDSRVCRARLQSTLVPVSVSSALAVALLAGRVYRSQTDTYAFLLWNLFLAWIPYMSSLWADYTHRGSRRQWWRLLLPGAVWLAFLPNGLYLLTDFWHLQQRAAVPLWYDIGLLAAFAWTGLVLAVFSLRTMHSLVRQFASSLMGWSFAAGTAGLAGFGVYLGRFLRWNSWDLVLNPKGVFADVVVRLADPMQHPRTLGVTLLFAAILFVCYLAFTAREPAS